MRDRTPQERIRSVLLIQSSDLPLAWPRSLLKVSAPSCFGLISAASLGSRALEGTPLTSTRSKRRVLRRFHLGPWSILLCSGEQPSNPGKAVVQRRESASLDPERLETTLNGAIGGRDQSHSSVSTKCFARDSHYITSRGDQDR